MTDRPVRFLHASDFHLEQPLGGISEVPEHLRELFIDAPYRAAQNVFDAAVAEHVDFVLLCGDLLQPEMTGPRGPAFLVEQFERLASQGISVCWALGEVDRWELWPSAVQLPNNVRLFARARPEDFVITREGRPLAHMAGAHHGQRHGFRPADFWPDKNGLLSIVIVHGEAPAEQMAERSIDYWALGSPHARHTPFTSPHVAHFPGSPQGRIPTEVGAHGATLVVVSPTRQFTLSSLTTDVVRWQHQRIVVEATTTREQLDRMFETRLQEIALSAGGVDVLVTWTIGGTGPLIAALRHGRGTGEVLTRLRHDYGRRSPCVWTVSVTVEPAATLPDTWYEQDSLRGEFLRSVRQLQNASLEHALATLNLEHYLGPRHRADELACAADLSDPERRQKILREAALLGAELLSGEDSQS